MIAASKFRRFFLGSVVETGPKSSCLARFWPDIFTPCVALALTAFAGRDLVRPAGWSSACVSQRFNIHHDRVRKASSKARRDALSSLLKVTTLAACVGLQRFCAAQRLALAARDLARNCEI